VSMDIFSAFMRLATSINVFFMREGFREGLISYRRSKG
jgi:hypothetical protein